MTEFGWSLPPGCGMLPGEEMLPPCCDECEEEGNNPECMLTCEKYKKHQAGVGASDDAMSQEETPFTYEHYNGMNTS